MKKSVVKNRGKQKKNTKTTSRKRKKRKGRKKKWIQDSLKKMKRKRTVGSFKKYCGGKVDEKCIKKALSSGSVKIKRKAIWFMNINKRRLKKKQI